MVLSSKRTLAGPPLRSASAFLLGPVPRINRKRGMGIGGKARDKKKTRQQTISKNIKTNRHNDVRNSSSSTSKQPTCFKMLSAVMAPPSTSAISAVVPETPEAVTAPSGKRRRSSRRSTMFSSIASDNFLRHSLVNRVKETPDSDVSGTAKRSKKWVRNVVDESPDTDITSSRWVPAKL